MIAKIFTLVCLLFMQHAFCCSNLYSAKGSDYSTVPPFVSASVSPLVMLVMGRDHQLYYEAYNDASDLDGDGYIDKVYSPNRVDYYGYFDSRIYYQYSTTNQRFEPAGYTGSDKKVPSSLQSSKQYWSGDFLNYVTMTRIDCLRKVLYGGRRIVDTTTSTVLERTFIPNDAHSFGKEYNGTSDGYDIREYAPFDIPSSGRHLFASTTSTSATSPPLLRVLTNRDQHIWQWVSKESPVAESYITLASGSNEAVTPTDYVVRVVVGSSSFPDSSCKLYPNGQYKPVGLLQKYGETDRLFFGLISGSYDRNMDGGVLRKNIGTFRDELNATSGIFTGIAGIVKTIDAFHIYDYKYSTTSYGGGWEVENPMPSSTSVFPDWGNPLGEMMYEAVRYFKGGSPTSSFTSAHIIDDELGLPRPAWNNPYNATNRCAKPIMLVLSDIYPSYDTDFLSVSSNTSSLSCNNTISGVTESLNAVSLANTISSAEGISGSYFIGKSGSTYDGACTEKTVTGFGSIQGLCPESPTKQGGYLSAAVANYAATHDVSSIAEDQTISSYMVGLSSPLPKIEIPVDGKTVTLVPFGKTVVAGGMSSVAGDFQPTCQIVDFYVQEVSADKKHGVFRVNFEDVEQGADHDMDVIIKYEYTVNANNTLTITLSKEYQSAGYVLHAGYIISGVENPGPYLEVASKPSTDIAYYLDTPPDRNSPGRGLSTILLSAGVTGDNDQYSRSRNFVPSSAGAAKLLENPMWYAAKWGGFTDNSTMPTGKPDQSVKWDADNDGVPDTYYFVANPGELEKKLGQAFAKLSQNISSGSAVAVPSQSRTGEGALYQAIFYPELRDSDNREVKWAGQVQAYWTDAAGNIREDTNGNKKLDKIDDRIVKFDGSTVYFYIDTNGNNVLDEDNGTGTNETVHNAIGEFKDINFLWSSSAWLNSISNAAVQRDYFSTAKGRHIMTFADVNSNALVDAGELQDFVWPSVAPSASALKDPTNYYSYLTLFNSFSDTSTVLDNLRTSDLSTYKTLLVEQAGRLVKFIRGDDIVAGTIPALMPAMRSRNIDYLDNSTVQMWRLGDIIYSTPIVVGRPQENFQTIYSDETYLDYYKQYRDRRQVLYVGANDGMIHAFNSGFYNSTARSFSTTHIAEAPYEIGQELWAYIPYNLLPHLLWLSEKDYGSAYHVAYMDLPPLVFDAKVFPADADHPHGWGTLLICGMRQGGGNIYADIDKTDGTAYNATIDRTMTSSFVVIDVTNPEVGLGNSTSPRVLAELNFPGMGFSTCTPGILPFSSATNSTDNEWFLVLGSGPADASGVAASTVLGSELSAQKGKVCIVDLKALAATSPSLQSLDSSGVLQTGMNVFSTTEAGSFISEFTTVDLDLDYKADVAYYGTVSGDNVYQKGTLRRIITNDNASDVLHWIGNSTLIDVSRPVSAAPSVAKDKKGRQWVYFGTGRYYNKGDVPQNGMMRFYGIKEPLDAFSRPTWQTVIEPDLYNSTRISVSDINTIVKHNDDGTNSTLTWADLLAEVGAKQGWYRDFIDTGERSFAQASIIGGAVFFTTYVPSDDVCSYLGNSYLWALYYETGCAYFRPVIGAIGGINSVRADLGQGFVGNTAVHINEDGSVTLNTQVEGGINTINGTLPVKARSGRNYWREN